jgi:hypothetical protein
MSREPTKTASRWIEQALRDQVHVAYGTVPLILEALPDDAPIDAPIRIKVREGARAMLMEQGYLTAEELSILPIEDAIRTARQRFRTER